MADPGGGHMSPLVVVSHIDKITYFRKKSKLFFSYVFDKYNVPFEFFENILFYSLPLSDKGYWNLSQKKLKIYNFNFYLSFLNKIFMYLECLLNNQKYRTSERIILYHKFKYLVNLICGYQQEQDVLRKYIYSNIHIHLQNVSSPFIYCILWFR